MRGQERRRSGKDFYPRPPRGGRLLGVVHVFAKIGISIHALREEGDLFSQQGFAVVGISIHALREEGDPCFVAQPLFQQISIHALREEGDPGRPRNGHDRGHFYPRPPRGGRQGGVDGLSNGRLISIHALREEGDHVAQPGQLANLLFLSTPSARRATLTGVMV